MHGLNELQHAWSAPDRGLAWVCDFIHDGRIRPARPESHPESSNSPSVCQESQSTEDTDGTEVTWRSPLTASFIAWFLVKLCVVRTLLLGRGGDDD